MVPSEGESTGRSKTDTGQKQNEASTWLGWNLRSVVDVYALFHTIFAIHTYRRSAFAKAALDDFARFDRQELTKGLKALKMTDDELKILFDRAILSDYGENPPMMMY